MNSVLSGIPVGAEHPDGRVEPLESGEYVHQEQLQRMTVADNLFVIADGYTNPVRCREDLVRHGYLR